MAFPIFYVLDSGGVNLNSGQDNISSSTTSPGRDIEIDMVTNRWKLVNGDIRLTSGLKSIAQECDLRIKLFYGEFNFDATAGTKFREKVWRKGTTPSIITSEMRDRLLGIPDVIEVEQTKVVVDSPNRTITVGYKLKTVFGTLNQSTKVVQ